MSSFPDRPHTALLVVDVQNGVVGAAHDRDAVVGRIAGLVEGARAAGASVVWVQHADDELERDSEAWQIVGELHPGESEPIVHKSYGDSFEATDLGDVLAERRVGRIVVAGAQTEACIRATIHGAFVRGYDTTLVADAHTTEDLTEWGNPPPDQVIAHTNLYWRFQGAPDRSADVVGSGDVTFD